MRFVEGVESSFRNKLYGVKADKLDVSRDYFDVRLSSDGISICKLVNESGSKDELYNNVCRELSLESNTDYLHFSLIMGLYFGCFNLYNYLYVSDNIRKVVVDSKPNRKDTINFIICNYSKLLSYFNDMYGIDDSCLKDILSKIMYIFSCDNYDYLYNNYIVRDLGKILIARSITNDFNNCYESICLFDSLNENNKIYS